VKFRVALTALAVVVQAGLGRAASAQRADSVASAPTVGSEQERYERLLQITGLARPYPLTVRALSPQDEQRLSPADTGHPWAGVDRASRVKHAGPVVWQALPVRDQVFFNSAFPYGFNDGPVWAGRGLTESVDAGVAARWGVLSLQIDPMVFVAQNTAFALAGSRRSGNAIYANAVRPGTIDLPQRFGPRSYARLDPGQTTLRVDVGPGSVGFSTADQFWGPAIESPLILGDNAAGFPNVFIGTAHPLDIGIGSVHGKAVYGRLEESPYAPPNAFGASRFASGVVGEFTPRGAPGLEIGAARFFHTPWPADGITASDVFHPFEGILKKSLATRTNQNGDDPEDNQLASVFFRWAMPASGMELYGEYGREDHNWDLRDLFMNIDHDAAYTLGLQRVWRRSATKWYVLRGEVMNSRISHQAPSENQESWYVHSPITQGHTELGQILGAPSGMGGGGSSISLDRYQPDGRWTVRLGREMQAELRGAGGLASPDSADVMQSLGVERLLKRSAMDLTFGATGVWDLNRNFGPDKFNLNLSFVASRHW